MIHSGKKKLMLEIFFLLKCINYKKNVKDIGVVVLMLHDSLSLENDT